jgi:hypothetical protein
MWHGGLGSAYLLPALSSMWISVSEYDLPSRITSEYSTVLCSSMQLGKAVGFGVRALDHWR